MRIRNYTSRSGNSGKQLVTYTTERINTYVPSKMSEENEKKRKQETDEKSEIFTIIADYIYSGKSMLELVNKLNSEPKFKKYGDYFSTWIDDINSKYQKLLAKIESERQKGKNNKQIYEMLLSAHHYKFQLKYFKELLNSEIKDEEKGIENE